MRTNKGGGHIYLYLYMSIHWLGGAPNQNVHDELCPVKIEFDILI